MLHNGGRRAAFKRVYRSSFCDLSLFAILVFGVIWFFVHSTGSLGYNWQWGRIPAFLFRIDESGLTWGPLMEGLMITFKISGISLVLAFTIGLTTALFRLSHSFLARAIAQFYLETSRNTPLLIQLFFIYFVVGPVIGLGRFPSAVLALSLFEGAYASEIFRAGIVSISRGQREASYSLGLSALDAYRFIILPQAIRRILPPLTSQAISLIKDSALVSTIAIYDLTMQAQALIAETFLTFELWFTVGGMYLVVTTALSLFVNYLENRFRIST